MAIAETLEKLVAAWNAQDVGAIVATFAADGAYHEPAGPDALGATHTGHAAIRRALERIFATYPDGRIVADGAPVIAGTRAHCEWYFEWTDRAGRPRRQRGVDIFEFEGEHLKHKSAYLKQYVAPAGA